MARRLRDQRREQAAVRDVSNLIGTWDVKELRALKRTAYELWGTRGLVEFDQDQPGIAKLGYFKSRTAAADQPNSERDVVWVFKGATHREITDQIATWRSKRS